MRGGYLGKDEETSSPILFGKFRKDRWYFGILMPCKGTGHPYCARTLKEELALAGDKSLVLRSDGEPAIVSLKEKVMAGDESKEALAECIVVCSCCLPLLPFAHRFGLYFILCIL